MQPPKVARSKKQTKTSTNSPSLRPQLSSAQSNANQYYLVNSASKNLQLSSPHRKLEFNFHLNSPPKLEASISAT